MFRVSSTTFSSAALLAALLASASACTAGGALPNTATAGAGQKTETAPVAEASLLEQARAAMAKRDFAAADTLFAQGVKQGLDAAWQAELWLTTGRYEELAKWQRPTPEISVLVATALRRLGRVEEAEAQLLTSFPELAQLSSPAASVSLAQSKAQLLLGELYQEQGKTEQARQQLTRLIANARVATQASAVAQLIYAGRAAALLRQPEASNALYNQAEQQLDAIAFPREQLDLLRFRAALFLQKHDNNQAAQLIRELLEASPADVDGRILYAQLLGEEAFDFAGAEELLMEVKKDNPHHAGVFFQLAGIALRDMELERARSWIEQGKRTNKRDLELLAMHAAVTFLAEDKHKFEQELEEFERLSPKNTRALLVVSQYAEWEHRYPDIERLMRKASRMDRDDPDVRTLLGLTMVRAGSDAAGIVELNRAYDLDPYDLRVINTLELYEKYIAQDYVSETRGPLNFRFPKAEAQLLSRYVPELAEQAWQQMVERYGFTPKAPISVEIYESSEQFSVRTAGVPRVGIQGVCFGRKLATMSPVASPGNLGMTLWHELGHVFHIGLSDYRVPRFLTEGLAEWETASQKRGWSRELDLELYQVRAAGGLPILSNMSRAFTHARGAQDMAAAYYASSLIAEFVVEKYGEPKMVEMLGEMGKARVSREVIPQVLGSSWNELDSSWESYLADFLKNYDQQFVPRLVRQPVSELSKLNQAKPDDLAVVEALGLAVLGAGDMKKAEELLSRVVEKRADSPQALFGLARIFIAQNNKQQASARLQAMRAAGHDGYAVAMLEARLALSGQDDEAAQNALRRALTFDARSEEAHSMLAALYRKQDDASAELQELLQWASLSEHDVFAHQRLVRVLLDAKKFKEAQAWSERLLWTDLAGAESHRLAGLSHARAGDWKRAVFEWESALLCPLDTQSAALLSKTWSDELQARGNQAESRRIETRVLDALARSAKH